MRNREIIILLSPHGSNDLRNAISQVSSQHLLAPHHSALLDTVAEGEYQTARFITQHPTVPIIRENSDAIHYSPMDAFEQANDLFPNGLPAKYSQLNYKQKCYLAYFGADVYALGKGIVTRTYSDDLRYHKDRAGFKKELSKRKNKPVSDAEVFQARELATLANAISVCENLDCKQIAIIYGPDHIFSDIAKHCFPKVTLTLKNFLSISDPALQQAFQQSHQATLAMRPPVNCSMIPYNLTNTNAQLPPSVNNQVDSYMDYSTIGCVALVGVLACGLCFFKCCPPSPKEEPAPKKQSKDEKRRKHLKRD